MLFFDREGLSHCETWVSDIKDDSGDEDRDVSSSLLASSRLLSASSKDGGEMAKRIKRSRNREGLSAAGDAVKNEFMTHGTIEDDDEVVEGSRTALLGKSGKKDSPPPQQSLPKKKKTKKSNKNNQTISTCSSSSFCPDIKIQRKAPPCEEALAVADHVQQRPLGLQKSKVHHIRKKKMKKNKRAHQRQQNEPTTL